MYKNILLVLICCLAGLATVNYLKISYESAVVCILFITFIIYLFASYFKKMQNKHIEDLLFSQREKNYWQNLKDVEFKQNMSILFNKFNNTSFHIDGDYMFMFQEKNTSGLLICLTYKIKISEKYIQDSISYFNNILKSSRQEEIISFHIYLSDKATDSEIKILDKYKFNIIYLDDLTDMAKGIKI